MKVSISAQQIYHSLFLGPMKSQENFLQNLKTQGLSHLLWEKDLHKKKLRFPRFSDVWDSKC